MRKAKIDIPAGEIQLEMGTEKKNIKMMRESAGHRSIDLAQDSQGADFVVSSELLARIGASRDDLVVSSLPYRHHGHHGPECRTGQTDATGQDFLTETNFNYFQNLHEDEDRPWGSRVARVLESYRDSLGRSGTRRGSGSVGAVARWIKSVRGSGPPVDRAPELSGHVAPSGGERAARVPVRGPAGPRRDAGRESRLLGGRGELEGEAGALPLR